MKGILEVVRQGRPGVVAFLALVLLGGVTAARAGVRSVGLQGEGTFASVVVPGGDHYVSPGGDDAAEGSAQKPWKTIARALKAAGPGVTINVRGGVYNEELKLDENGGAGGAPFTLQSAEGERAVLDGQFKMKTGIEIRTPYVAIRGLRVRNYRQNGMFVRGPKAHHVLIERNVIHNISDSSQGEGEPSRGIWLIAVSDCTIRRNTIYYVMGNKECMGVLFDVRSSDKVPIHNTVIERNLFYWLDKSGVRIVDNSHPGRCHVLADPAYIRGNICVHNAYLGIEVNYMNTDTGGQVLSTGGPLGEQTGAPIYTEDNFVGWCSEFGLNPKQSAYGVSRHNTVYATEHIGYLQSGYPSYHMRIEGNLLVDNIIGTFVGTVGEDNQFIGNYYRQPAGWPGFFGDRTDGWGTMWTDIDELRKKSALRGVEARGMLDNESSLFRAPGKGDFRLIAGCPAAGTAPDGEDFGARESVLSGVGASGKWGLGNIPLLPEVRGMRVVGFSSEDRDPCSIDADEHYPSRSKEVDARKAAAGSAAHLVDGAHSNSWRPAKGQTTGWVAIDLPGDEPIPLGAFMINVSHNGRRCACSPREMKLYGRLSEKDVWQEIGTYSRYSREEGRVFPIWPIYPEFSARGAPVARQLKLEVLSNHGMPGVVEIGEFRLYKAAVPIE